MLIHSLERMLSTARMSGPRPSRFYSSREQTLLIRINVEPAEREVTSCSTFVLPVFQCTSHYTEEST